MTLVYQHVNMVSRYKSLFWFLLAIFFLFCAWSNLWFAWLITIERMLPKHINLWQWYICIATILFYKTIRSRFDTYLHYDKSYQQILNEAVQNNVQHVIVIATSSASHVSSKNHRLNWEGPFPIAFTRWTPAPNHLQCVPSTL
jgi:hypothetical protein